MARVAVALPPVHKSCSSISRRSGLCDVKGTGGEPCSVRGHRFALFYSRFHSRFAPDFAPDSRFNSISLRHTRSGRIAHRVNANIVHSLTPLHSIPVSTDRHFLERSSVDERDGVRCGRMRSTRKRCAPQNRKHGIGLPPHRSRPQPLIILGDAIRTTGRCARSVLGPAHEPFPPPRP